MGVIDDIGAQRKRIVVLCAAVVCMAAAGFMLRRHPLVVAGLIVLQVITLVYAMVEFMRMKRQER